MTTTAKVTTRDLLNSDVLGRMADGLVSAPLGEILSVLLDTRNTGLTVAATTIGAAVTPTSSTTAQASATTPANVSYTQADQTAIADLANALKTLANQLVADVATLSTRLNQARVDILALRSSLAANNVGTVGGATETGITVTSNVATLAANAGALITVNATTGTHTGVKKLIRDPNRTLATGEVYWNGLATLTFAAIDAVTVCDVIYSKADGSQKASCLLTNATK